ncbi:hypothetical protein ACMHYJ_05405 [Castellaniella hirudinis]|uniref:hypothetical protein n=1 Tax=Castellaniella hirudinis TaxID=1144617 RepID=UPI0039C382AA
MKFLASLLPDALMLAGSAGVSYGAWLIYEPAGYLVAGLLALAAGVMCARVVGK